MDKQLNTLHKNPTWIQQNLKQSCSDSTLTVFVFYNEVTWMIFWGNFLLVNGLTTQYLKTRSKFKYLFDSLWWSWSHWRGRFQNLLAFWGHKTSFLRYIELTFEVWKFVKSFFCPLYLFNFFWQSIKTQQLTCLKLLFNFQRNGILIFSYSTNT